jgi:integrase/recombinase XerD
MLTACRESANPCDFAPVAMLGLRIFEATNSNIGDLGEEQGHRVLRVCGRGTKVVLIPLPPAVGRAIDRAIGDRAHGPILLNTPPDQNGHPRRKPVASGRHQMFG